MTKNNSSAPTPKLDEAPKETNKPSEYGAIYDALPDDGRAKGTNQFGLLLLDNPSLFKRILYKILSFYIPQISCGIIFHVLYPPPCHDVIGPCSSFTWWMYLYALTAIISLTIDALWVASFNFNFKSAYKIVLEPKFETMKFVWSVAGILAYYYILTTIANLSSLEEYRSYNSFVVYGQLILALLLCAGMVQSFTHNTVRLIFRFVKIKD